LNLSWRTMNPSRAYQLPSCFIYSTKYFTYYILYNTIYNCRRCGKIFIVFNILYTSLFSINLLIYQKMNELCIILYSLLLKTGFILIQIKINLF